MYGVGCKEVTFLMDGRDVHGNSFGLIKQWASCRI
jgi:hypothetical protein